MVVAIGEVLRSLAASALDNRQKGDRLEALTHRVLQEAPLYADRYDEVYLWKDWPERGSRPDAGIDLVARQRDGGGWTAIQCKFYEPGHLIARKDIDSFLTASGKEGFTQRLIVSTTEWGKNAEEAIHGQSVPVQRVDVFGWDQLGLQWASPEVTDVQVQAKHDPRPHQVEAIAAVLDGMAAADRGQLIMACGTGKTFTSLKLAERQVGAGGSVLFLVPSISLLSQSLTEWCRESAVPLRPFAVCSDVKVGRRNLDEDMSVVDLPEPATTNGAKLIERMNRSADRAAESMTVIFSTYQSLQAVNEAQAQHGLGDFDLVVCDEAHRTTGVTLAGEDESAFVRIHNPAYVKAAKRVYMTATPRLYNEASKAKAGESDAVLASMDDESRFGPVWHRLGFGDAVERDLLSDYKVLILAVDEGTVAERFQQQWASGDVELNLDDTARLVGCWNGLAKQNLPELGGTPMRRAVAFAGNIKASTQVAGMFEQVAKECATRAEAESPESPAALRIESAHVDGTFNILERNRLLTWLKAPLSDHENTCRILSNARCLSEGVDVPALDAVLFLNPRKSVVDVVQSVGRVMRKADGKEFGYVILPIAIPAGLTPEQALADNKRYAVVWEVLQALRAHDDRFNAEINKIDFNKSSNQIVAVTVPGPDRDDRTDPNAHPELPLHWGDELRTAIYARMVQKVGQRTYWEDWAKDIAKIADAHVTRIRTLLDDPALDVQPLFDKFLIGLRANLNNGISRDNAIEMLAQHIITKPVFDALFEGYDFTAHNPVSLVMQDMLDVLNEQGIDTEAETLDKFYASVANRARGITTAEGKQQIITQLYEKFFKNAFPKAAESLGIVYTPIEIVDFILRSVEHLLNNEFGASLNDEGVHVLDPFTGTGTFIVRLLQSGLVSAENLLRKYTAELHANEVSLLAYYVAAVNIEATFHGLHDPDSESYTPFDGIVLADTFQMAEEGDVDDTLDGGFFVQNNERVVRQRKVPIRVIVGNPPYSAGQTSANDDNANLKYPSLDRRIEETYAARSTAKLKNKLYDSYVRAIRWASDRVGETGVVGFVTNGSYIKENVFDGLRLSIFDDFDRLYVYNLRGNQRTAGELSRREGGKVFGSGSRATVAVMFLVKGGVGGPKLLYRDIGDYISREAKLAIVEDDLLSEIEWVAVTPNASGDWVDHRRADIAQFEPLDELLARRTHGVNSGRDLWAVNSSRSRLQRAMRRAIETFNAAVTTWEPGFDAKSVLDYVTNDPSQISWSRNVLAAVPRGNQSHFEPASMRTTTYRPFFKQWLYLSGFWNSAPGRSRELLPSSKHSNIVIYIVGMSSSVPFSVLAMADVPNLHVTGAGSGGVVYARWTYELVDEDALDLDTNENVIDGYRRVDNITDAALIKYQANYADSKITKDDVFYYIYGLLHSPAYREQFAADLTKMLPRIPTVRDFHGYAVAGRQLAELHVGYESVDPYPLEEVVTVRLADDYAQYAVTDKKMRFGSKGKDHTIIEYNPRISLSGIPEDAYRYQIGSRSAIEWVIDRYYVRTDKPSGIVNDPNEWSREHQEPRYIIDLLKRVVRVSLDTMQIVDALPPLEILDPQ